MFSNNNAITLQNRAWVKRWVKSPFKVQDRPMYFSKQEHQKFTDGFRIHMAINL